MFVYFVVSVYPGGNLSFKDFLQKRLDQRNHFWIEAIGQSVARSDHQLFSCKQ